MEGDGDGDVEIVGGGGQIRLGGLYLVEVFYGVVEVGMV